MRWITLLISLLAGPGWAEEPWVMDAGTATRTVTATHGWMPGEAPAGFPGSAPLQASPDMGLNAESGTPVLSFAWTPPAPGTYYVWLVGWAKGGAADTAVVGLNGARLSRVSFEPLREWTRSKPVPITVDATPVSVDVHMREDGLWLAQLAITRTALWEAPDPDGDTGEHSFPLVFTWRQADVAEFPSMTWRLRYKLGGQDYVHIQGIEQQRYERSVLAFPDTELTAWVRACEPKGCSAWSLPVTVTLKLPVDEVDPDAGTGDAETPVELSIQLVN